MSYQSQTIYVKMLVKHEMHAQNIVSATVFVQYIQETQLLLTNLCNAFIGQSRSPNIVPFHMLDIVSYCAIVTFVFKTGRFYDIRLQKCCDLEIWVRGHSRSLKVVPFYRFGVVSY